MNDCNVVKQILNDTLDFYIYKNKQNTICRKITQSIKLLEAKELYDFLKWHNIVSLLPTNSSFDNFDYKREIFKKNDELLNISKTITSVFQKERINFCFLKGISLLLTLYDDIGVRNFNDIDLFVDKKDLSKVKEIMEALGFVQGDIVDGEIIQPSKKQIKFQELYTHELYRFVKWGTNRFVCVDINFLFSWKGINNSIKCVTLANDDMVENIHCDNLKLPVLNDYYQLLHLFIHFYNEAMYFALEQKYDGRDPREIRLFRLYDIVFLLHKNNFEISKFVELCSAFKANEIVSYVVSVIVYLFGNRVFLKDFCTYFSSVDIELKNYYFTKNGKCMEWPFSFSNRIFKINMRSEMPGWLIY